MNNFWQKLPRRSKIAIAVPLGLLASCCVCFGGFYAYGSTLPTRTPTMTATETLTPTVTSTSTQTGTPTITPTATRTPIPSETPLPTETFTPRPTDTSTLAPTNTQAPASITLVSLTSPIKRGNTATLVIKTVPGASCFLSYTTPAGGASDASGLGSKTADANGQCKWSWLIGGSTSGGTGYVSVSVGGVSQTFPIEITE